jgi:RHS repeat-associated protein
LPIAGTPYFLHYSSAHQRGRHAQLDIPLNGSTMPGSPKSVALDIKIAGREFQQNFLPVAGDHTTFTWDGMDVFGRLVQGQQPVTVRVGNVYAGVYSATPRFFYFGTGAPITGGESRQDVTVWGTWTGNLGAWDSQPEGLGGWTVNVHHNYEVGSGTLHLGTGGDITSTSTPDVVQQIQSTSTTNTTYFNMRIAVDGSTYFDGVDNCVHRISPQGLLSVVAGRCNASGFGGDNGPATAATLQYYVTVAITTSSGEGDIAFGPDGSLYISDSLNNRVRRVDAQSGFITTVAGGGGDESVCFGNDPSRGDGRLATNACLSDPHGIDVAADGTLYILDHYLGVIPPFLDSPRIRRVTPDGIITTVLGQGNSFNVDVPGTAYGAGISDGPIRVARDGSVYFFDGSSVRRLDPQGFVRAFAGNPSQLGYSGDGGPATSARFLSPNTLAIDRNGAVLIGDQNSSVVRRVDPYGTIGTVLGGGTAAQHSLIATNWWNGNTFHGVMGMDDRPDGVLRFLSQDTSLQTNVYEVLHQSSGSLGAGELHILGSRDASQIFEFDSYGRHLYTLDALTGATLFGFGYGDAGQLVSVTDAYNRTTKFNNSGGVLTITPPQHFGGQSSGTLDTNGYLTSLTDPANQTASFTYTSDGLMKTMVDTQGGQHVFDYDPATGRLTQDSNPAGGVKTLSSPVLVSTDGGTGSVVSITTLHDSTTSTSYATAYQTLMSSTGTLQRLNTTPNGLQASLSYSTAGVTQTVDADGTQSIETDTPDPRFGMLAPMRSVTRTTPGGISITSAVTRSPTFATDGGLTSLTETAAVTNEDGGLGTWTTQFTASSMQKVITSPVGRTVTLTIDGTERVTQVFAGTGTSALLPVQFGYDPNSEHLFTRTEEGSYLLLDGGTSSAARVWQYAYDSNGYLHSVTDPLDNAISYTNDPVGRPTDTFLPAGDGGTRDLVATFDAGLADPSSIQLPRSAAELHMFGYTPVGDLSTYSPPDPSVVDAGLDATLVGPWATQYTYYNDRELKTETRPDGTVITRGYDSAGRLSTVSFPQGTATWTYNDTPGTPGVGHEASVMMSASPYNFGMGQGLGFGYDGPLLTSLTWTGAVGGTTGATVGFQYAPGFLPKAITINGAAPVTFQYDSDNLLAQVVGASTMTLTRNMSNGLLTGTSISGGVSDSYQPDPNGRFEVYSAMLGSASTYTEYVKRYADNRIAQKTETITGGAGHVWQYSYDAPGRLIGVMLDGNLASQYSYDDDDNRATFTKASGPPTTASYDGQDRLVRYGAIHYSYGNNGELQSKTDSTGTTYYVYDAFGNLVTVTKPDGTTLQYVVDGDNHRVAKYTNGLLQVQYLWDDKGRVVATLAPGPITTVTTQFVYATKENVPDLVVSGGTPYRVISDHLGSPRLLVNATSGAVVAQLDYDEFGNATIVSGQSVLAYLMPFGFAGGLYDADTELVRFGARDYDPSIGRWTAKDPLRFRGDSMNLYGYVLSDPVDFRDSSGMNLLLTVPICASHNDACKARCVEKFPINCDKWNQDQEVPPVTVGEGDPEVRAQEQCIQDCDFCYTWCLQSDPTWWNIFSLQHGRWPAGEVLGAECNP